MQQPHSFYVLVVDVRGIGIWDHATKRMDSAWRQIHPMLELGWSASCPRERAPYVNRRMGFAYGDMYFGWRYLCDGQPCQGEKSTGRSAVLARRSREALPHAVLLVGRSRRAQALRLGSRWRKPGRNMFGPSRAVGDAVARSNDIAQPELMGAQRGSHRFSVSHADRPILRISPADLDTLVGTLEVRRVTLEECTLKGERRFEPGNDGMTRLYYGLWGIGSLTTSNGLPITIAQHTLVVVPPVSRGHLQFRPVREDRTLLAGSARVLCGHFHAAFGDVVDMFGGLSTPIVERFSEGDDLPTKLKLALVELQGKQPGSVAMTSLLMKQALLLLLRRSLTSPNPWVERFAILRDYRISKAFAEMTARPGAGHTVDSLARIACLSRSTFMARFFELIGRAPMSVLRDLRMRQAAQQLRVTGVSIGQIGKAAGYANNSGFIRAFRKAYGMDPREYRCQALLPSGDVPHPVFQTNDPSEL